MKSINKVLMTAVLGGALFLTAEECLAESEKRLLEILREGSLELVASELRSGQIEPPRFVLERKLVVEANATVPLFLELLQKSRDSVNTGRTTAHAYSKHVQSLYEYFSRFDSYVSVLLADCLKRCLLETVQKQAMAAGSNADALNRFLQQTTHTALTPNQLKVLYGDLARTAAETGPDTAEATLAAVAEQVWMSHGHNEVTDGYRGVAQVLQKHKFRYDCASSRLLREYAPESLALRILNTECIRVAVLDGSMEFLRRGGQLQRVDAADTRYFDSVMPKEECMKFTFAPLGRIRFDLARLLVFADSEMFSTVVMKPVFE